MATVALKNINGLELTVQDRELVVVAGPPGSGPSVIIRMIAGLEKISQGDILLDERCINDLPPKDRDVGFLSHDYMPYPGMSVYRNVAIGLERRKFADIEIRKRVANVTETLGLQDHLAADPGGLSAEQRRLVGLARVMVRQPKVYLFDEPFGKLDRGVAIRGRAAIAELRQRSSATMLYATSDPMEALAFSARTVVMEGGVVQQDDEAQAVFDDPANLFVAKFFGEPAMNLVHGILRQERDGIMFSETGEGTIAIRLPASHFGAAAGLVGQPVVLGFRPDAVKITSSPGHKERPGATFRALVERSESRGTETDLYLRTGAHELVCRTCDLAEGGGHRFQFEIDLEKVRLFEAASGRRLTGAT